jgi:hypothetical protein
MKKLAILSVSLALTLSACGGEDSHGKDTVDTAAINESADAPKNPAAVPSERPAQTDIAAGASGPDGTLGKPSPLETNVIPAKFRGRWGMVPADCTSKRGDSKGLMTIEANSIRFYESVAKPSILTLVGDRRIDGNFAASGEGQQWTLLMQLGLDEDGKSLTRIVDEGDSAPDRAGNRFTYRRCA